MMKVDDQENLSIPNLVVPEDASTVSLLEIWHMAE